MDACAKYHKVADWTQLIHYKAEHQICHNDSEVSNRSICCPIQVEHRINLHKRSTITSAATAYPYITHLYNTITSLDQHTALTSPGHKHFIPFMAHSASYLIHDFKAPVRATKANALSPWFRSNNSKPSLAEKLKSLFLAPGIPFWLQDFAKGSHFV